MTSPQDGRSSGGSKNGASARPCENRLAGWNVGIKQETPRKSYFLYLHNELLHHLGTGGSHHSKFTGTLHHVKHVTASTGTSEATSAAGKDKVATV